MRSTSFTKSSVNKNSLLLVTKRVPMVETSAKLSPGNTLRLKLGLSAICFLDLLLSFGGVVLFCVLTSAPSQLTSLLMVSRWLETLSRLFEPSSTPSLKSLSPVFPT